MVIEVKDADGRIVTLSVSPVVAGAATIVVDVKSANRTRRILSSVLTLKEADARLLVAQLGVTL